ncbi:glycogen debranching protein [Flavobacterium crocinum]|uniref:Glycogen debranching protein n=1 Tax=Flavobacterium crocinum TaxID=2183896 RepID=A0A2S1YQC3_9FLAO|nr:DUF4450 domain-containing protein [Flavobacterium crocinum]AWK06314.1 glycogen debranching protein [Flavobacterium crocinum]
MKSKTSLVAVFTGILFLNSFVINGQEKMTRKIHYAPEGNSFVLKNGTRKFNRALYGSNTGFRAEAGDLPEFALYMPGMGGNFKLGLISGKNSRWITEASKIHTSYVQGTMHYEIQDAILGSGRLIVDVVALRDKEGFILKVSGVNVPKECSLMWVYGGATGKKFSRDGDIGADPESVFYLKPEYCINNKYTLEKQSFLLEYGSESNKQKDGNNKSLTGYFPDSAVHLANAEKQNSPLELYNSNSESLMVVAGKVKNFQNENYWLLTPEKAQNLTQKNIALLYEEAVQQTTVLANRVKVVTPDPYINTLGGALAIASDGIWESPAYLHGAVAWRMYLNAWRGAYTADPLGWHDRAKSHFKSYSNSQVTSPENGPVVFDPEKNLARQKEEIGTSMFSSGYISRNPNKNTVAHHYDMNLVFIDQMLRHFKWTGDTDFMKEMWPVLQRHINWEKRNFDADGDGLYDAYASIWASDALQYSGGSVIHSSAYNYYANKTIASAAQKIQEDGLPFSKEADKILKASNQILWLPNKGIFAEYKDALGNRLLHETPGVWSIYHTIDSEMATPFESFQMLHYVDKQIPRIPIQAEGLDRTDLFTISTTNWQPYTWSVNNVALAEQLHTALAFWQGGQSEKAYHLWESALIESMYLGASPGAFEQLLYQDAMRGELYRDFADPIGMASRTLVEGLYGIQPDALAGTLTISPGFPSQWDQASIEIPDISFSFKRENKKDSYKIENRFQSKMSLKLLLDAPFDKIQNIMINGKIASYKAISENIGKPKICIEVPYSAIYDVIVNWKGFPLEEKKQTPFYTSGQDLHLMTFKAEILSVYDPQSVLSAISKTQNELHAKLNGEGNSVFFIKLKQGEMSWWDPVEVNFKPKLEAAAKLTEGNTLEISIKNNTVKKIEGSLVLNTNEKASQPINFNVLEKKTVQIPVQDLMPGTNRLEIKNGNSSIQNVEIINWDIPFSASHKQESIALSSYFNAKVTDVFTNEYLSPRPKTTTLQLPKQGIGNWCYPNLEVKIDDSGLREKAKNKEQIISSEGIVFKTPSAADQKNIVFTSMWDNYPESVMIPLSGKASHVYFMVAGTTNPMQSRMTNGEIIVNYTDGTSEVLALKNPENWWPIEQDYFTDGLAFTTDAPKPPRIYLKSGEISRDFKDFKPIKGLTNYGVEGGAGTILDLPLDKNKTLKSLTLKTIANDVVIGLMSLTLIR